MKKINLKYAALCFAVVVSAVAHNASAQATFAVSDMVGDIEGFSFTTTATHTQFCEGAVGSVGDVRVPESMLFRFVGPDNYTYGFDKGYWRNSGLTEECANRITTEFMTNYPRSFNWEEYPYYKTYLLGVDPVVTQRQRLGSAAIDCIEDQIDDLEDVLDEEKYSSLLKSLSNGQVVLSFQLGNITVNPAYEIPTRNSDNPEDLRPIRVKFGQERAYNGSAHCRRPNKGDFKDVLDDLIDIRNGDRE